MQEKECDSEGKKSLWRVLFDDLSIAQLLAGALAAVTSMFLASRIGIAGSLIGAAVGSIVSAVASQLYKKFLSASAEKIKVLAPGHDEASVEDGSSGQATLPISPVDGPTSAMQTTVVGGMAAQTQAMPPISPRSPESQAYADSALSRARSARERKATIQKRAVIVAAASALAAMLLSAVVIEVVTAGQGVGSKPPSIGSTWSVPKDVQEEPADASNVQGGAAPAANGQDSQQAPDGADAQNAAAGQGSSSGDASAPAPDAGASSPSAQGGSSSAGADSSQNASGGQGQDGGKPQQPDPNAGSDNAGGAGSASGSGSADGSSAGAPQGGSGSAAPASSGSSS